MSNTERRVGTVSRGIRCPIIRQGDDLAAIVTESVLLAAESEVHKAMATAMKNGKFGVMDYYKLQNLTADTKMRNSISGTKEEKPSDNGKPTREGM